MILNLAVAASLALTTTPVKSGEGWRALDYIDSISTAAPYEINFGSEAARSRLQPYARDIAAQIAATTGVEVIVTSDVVSTWERTCASTPYHEITMGYKYRPMDGREGYSVAHPCAHSNGSAWGGWLFIDNEYWNCGCNWFSVNDDVNEAIRANVVTHEVGHMFGLEHASVAEGLQPVMDTPPVGGYRYPPNGGKFTKYDIAGLQQMVANYNG